MSCEAVILAGGLSSRMGTDKAKLKLGGATLLSRVRHLAKEAGFPVRVLRKDLVPRCGPLGGIYTGLRTSKADVVLFLSCDMPFITGALLHSLISRLSPKTTAVFLFHRKAGFPIAIRRRALSEVTALIAERRFSLQGLARRLEAGLFQLPRGAERMVLNVNTRAEYEMAKELVS